MRSMEAYPRAAMQRATLAGCQVVVHQHLNGTLSLTHGPHCLGRYDAGGTPLPTKASTELSRERGMPPSLQPQPQNQPNPIGEGTILKPDISPATKTGHFNLLPTAEWTAVSWKEDIEIALFLSKSKDGLVARLCSKLIAEG